MSKSDANAYLKFDRAALAGRKILSAKLRLKVLRTNVTEGGVVVHPSSAAWSADTLTYKSRPHVVLAQLKGEDTPSAKLEAK